MVTSSLVSLGHTTTTPVFLKTEDATADDGTQVVHATDAANGDCSTASDLWGSEVGDTTATTGPPVDAVASHGDADQQGSELEAGEAGEGSAQAETAAAGARQEAEASARAVEEAAEAEEEWARVAAEEQAAQTAAATASTPIELARDLGLADDQLLFLMSSPVKPRSHPLTEPSSPQLSLTLTQCSPLNAEEAVDRKSVV